jgi:D-sedoheptulose 7-phosphate isomerase
MKHVDELVERYPVLAPCRAPVAAAIEALIRCFTAGGKLLVCGNGGSAADCEHIVGELMKGFLLLRQLPEETKARLCAVDPALGGALAGKLQGALPTINLASLSSLGSAYANDVTADFVYAQGVHGHGKPGDVLLGISTSGNALNVRAALCTARAKDMTTIGLTGNGGGKIAGFCDILIAVPDTRTFAIQELHLPVYHCLCAAVEAHFFT